MARRKFRLRVWMLMILVAVAAVGMGGWRLRRLSQKYQGLAVFHEQEVRSWSETLASDEQILAGLKESLAQAKRNRKGSISEDMRRILEESDTKIAETMKSDVVSAEGWVERDRAWVAYHTEMARKYGRAARSPWLPVAPDLPAPPEPESELELK